MGIDERRNQVVVYVAEGVAAARSALAGYGRAVRIEEGQAKQRNCVSRVACGPPYRAGLFMFSQNLDGAANGGCTSGFVVRQPFAGVEDPTGGLLDQLTGGPSYGLLTAGHCEIAPNGERVFYHPANQVVGMISENFYKDQSGLDAGIIRISEEYATNWLYTRASNTPYRITSSQELNTDAVDDVVCMSVPYFNAEDGGSLREGAKCGRISAIHVEQYDETPDGPTLYDQYIAIFEGGSRAGDSGGPIFKNIGIASGVLSASVVLLDGTETDALFYWRDRIRQRVQ